MRLLISALIVIGLAPAADGPRFTVTVPSSVRAEAVTGRVYVAISKTNDRTPIQQTDTNGVPLFGVNIESLSPGAAVVVDATAAGHPLKSLRDLPAGDYWAQAFVNVYTRFARADGHTVWMHMDQWEGQNWKRSPGNIEGAPVRIHFDPASSTPIALVADKLIPPTAPPVDTASVKYLKIQSDILTKWWGHPIFLGAIVQLPDGYAEHPTVKYPVVYNHGHFPATVPGARRGQSEPPPPPGPGAGRWRRSAGRSPRG